MKPALFVVTQRGNLAPANGRAQEDIRQLKLGPGDFVTVQVMRSRNAKLCALAHVVIAKIADGLGVPSDTIKTRLKLALGYTDLIERPDGTIDQRPRSMAFDDFPDEDSFREFWRAVEQIVGDLLPELEPNEQAEVLAVMAGR